MVKSVYNCVAEYTICKDDVAECYLIYAIEDFLTASNEERRLRVLENGMLRGMFGSKRVR
jgi:hypothetical protein